MAIRRKSTTTVASTATTVNEGPSFAQRLKAAVERAARSDTAQTLGQGTVLGAAAGLGLAAMSHTYDLLT